jgi:hypothetical protein
LAEGFESTFLNNEHVDINKDGIVGAQCNLFTKDHKAAFKSNVLTSLRQNPVVKSLSNGSTMSIIEHAAAIISTLDDEIDGSDTFYICGETLREQ